MQSLIERYISTFSRSSTITPAIISYDDALILIEKWTKKSHETIEKLKKDYIPGLMIYETPEDKVEFPIAEVRRFISDSSKKSYEDNYIYMLLGVDTASHEAMNALLKVLEDTPENAIILLVVSDRESLLDTIHSRTIDLFRQSRKIIDTTHEESIRQFFSGNQKDWISILYSAKFTKEESIDILTLALRYADGRYIESIEDGIIQILTTNTAPKNILDTIFLS